MRALPRGWTEAPLEALVDILDSARIPLNSAEREARITEKPLNKRYPYYGATGQVGEIDDFLFDEPLILLGEDGVPFLERARHKAYLVQGKCWVNNHAHVLRSIDAAVDRRYLASFLNVFDYTGFVTGTTRLKLTQSAMRLIPVPIAPRAEQNRIADKLDALLARVDACRERLDRVPAILKRFRQSVLAAAISGELTREWREEHGTFDEWKDVLLGSVLTDVRYGTAKKCSYEPRKTPVLRIPNISEGKINHDDIKYAEFDESERTKLALAPGDLLMIRSNGSVGLVGRMALVSERETGFLYAGYLIRLRADVTQARPAYLSLFLASPPSRIRIELTCRSTTGVNNINAEEIREFPILLPTLDEQDEIVRRVDDLFALADRLQQRVSAAQSLADRATPSILDKAFRGELVPQDPNDEPASVLLDRIRAERATGSQPPTRRPRATPPDDAPPPPAVAHRQKPKRPPQAAAADPDRRPLEDYTTDEMMSHFRAASRAGGDMTEDGLLHLVLARLGMQRLNTKATAILKGHLKAAVGRGIIEREGFFLRCKTPTILHYERPDLIDALTSVMRKNQPYEREDVIQALAVHLGYSTVTDAMHDTMKSVFNSAIRQGVLHRSGSTIIRGG